MSDRIHSVLVTFDRDIREDDAEHYINAIRMIKGVVDVAPNIVDVNSYVADRRVKSKLKEALYEAIDKAFGDA